MAFQFSTGDILENAATAPIFANDMNDDFLELKKNNWYRTSGNSISDRNWISTPTLQAQLYLYAATLQNQTLPSHLSFGLWTRDWTTSLMDTCVARKSFPDYVSPTLSGEAHKLQIVLINSGKSYIPRLDEIQPDEKHLSIGLQEDRNHKIRVYKFPDPYVEGQFVYSVVTNKITWSLLHKLIALLPKLFNWEIDEEVNTLCRLLGLGKGDEWEETYMAWLNKHSPIEARRKKRFLEFCEKLNSSRLNSIRDQLKDTTNRIDKYEDELNRLLRQQEELQIKFAGIKLAPNTEGEELFEYFTHHKKIFRFEIAQNSSSIFNLWVKTPLLYYDPAVVEKYLNKTSSLIYSAGPEIAELLEQTLVKGVYTLWLETAFNYRLINDGNPPVCRRERSELTKCAFPNTHIMDLNCWGNNKPTIMKLQQNQQHIEAIEQAVAACSNINFLDYAVFEKMMDNMRSNSHRSLPCFEDNTSHEMFSINQLVAKMKKEAV